MSSARLIANFFKSRKTAHASRAKIDTLRNKQLRNVLIHAYDNAPFYRNLYEEAGLSRNDLHTVPLERIPPIDKAALMEGFNDIVCVPGITRDRLIAFDEEEPNLSAVFEDSYHVVHSSGSTGKPGYFLYNKNAWEQMIGGIVRGALWGMSTLEVLRLLLSRPRVLYVAATDGRYGGVMAVSDGVASLKMEQRSLDINTPLAEWLEMVRDFDPTIVIGYPSAIKILADLLSDGEINPSVRLVISCGEPLSAGLRTFFENSFEASIVNFYGASESLALGVEVDPREGMVLFDDLNWVEVLPDGIYVTSLYNFAQPLIRYKLSDKLTRKEATDTSCSFTCVESVQGRSEDVLWFEHGQGREYLHPLAVEGFNIEGLHDYQFRKTAPDAFVMEAEVPNRARRDFVHDEMLRQMRPILEANGLARISFDVRFVEAIAPDPRTGKKRLIAV